MIGIRVGLLGVWCNRAVVDQTRVISSGNGTSEPCIEFFCLFVGGCTMRDKHRGYCIRSHHSLPWWRSGF